MNAGTDLALGGEYGSTLPACVQSGFVSEARVTQALNRTLTAQFQLGWFDTLAALQQGLPDPVAVYNDVSVAGNVSTPAHRALSLHAAKQGLVLLKNAGSVLPLTAASLRKVALIGPAGNYTPQTATSSYIGNYSPCEAGPGAPLIPDPRCNVVTLLDALQAEAGSAGFGFTFAAGCDVNTVDERQFPAALAAVKGADVIVAAMGLNTCQETACSEGEANDRLVTLDLPGSQLALLQAVAAAAPGVPIILVLFNGGPVSSPWAYGEAAAVLEAWYPGYEGGTAVADALFGRYSPAGRLPVTIVQDMSDLPLYTNFVLSTPPGRTHRYYSGNNLLFPFGFGLSYANFTYSDLLVQPAVLTRSDEEVVISVTLTHASGPVSDEVVEVFGSFQAPSVGLASVPLQQLLAFTRVYNWSVGDSDTVSFTLPRSALALVAPDGALGVNKGTWILTVGGGPPGGDRFPGGVPVLQAKLQVQ